MCLPLKGGNQPKMPFALSLSKGKENRMPEWSTTTIQASPHFDFDAKNLRHTHGPNTISAVTTRIVPLMGREINVIGSP
jgi:hypothetical protein